MSKKIMLLALAVASVAMFALPSAASAKEIHWITAPNTPFTGTTGAGDLSTTSEPTITCESGHVTGTVAEGGTTGTAQFDFTNCHVVIGFTFKCHTSGSALDNTIKAEGTWHLITSPTGSPEMLMTTTETKVICASISNTIVKGNLIGTITSPACGGESKTMTTSFAATGSTQNHLEYTGAKYDLTAETEGSKEPKTAGLTATGTTEQASAGKLECT